VLASLVVSAALLVSTAAVADDEPMPLTLADALAMAGRANPDLRATRERSQAAQARGAAEGRALWPRLSGASEWARTDTPARVFASKLNRGQFAAEDFAIDRLNDPAPLSHLATSILLEAPLDVFGTTRAQARSAAAVGRASAALVDEAAQELRLRVVDAYRGLVLARVAVGATVRALEGANAREADIEAQTSEGVALEADRLRARARRRLREADVAARQSELRIAQATLGRLLGAPVGTSFEATEAAPAPPPLAADLSAWAARAVAARGALQAARERLESARWSERAERRSRLPDVSAYGQLQDDRGSLSDRRTSGSLGVVLRWNLLDPSRGKRMAAAAAEARASAEESRAAEDQVRLEVEIAFQRAETARERYAAAAGGAAEGREALRVIQERRQAGRATLTDELETEAASLAAELEEMRAAAEAAIADAALRRAAGEL